ncbi:MAG TPA: MazG nucleotide pyrophosphohydrolase domain-containing protein [Acidimicrobiales bacterium]|nr:MazG nucleotide pyrophosphohydrolase domain-containing protein [Acidimicrobiales bacterium]
MTALIRVVGLGPAGPELLTARTRRLISESPVVRLRTRRHPAAEEFTGVVSYDEWYERAESFEALYADIARDLGELAATSPNAEVVYAVPGSPVVAERTVELLRTNPSVRVVCEPAVSVIDVACAALGRDPMAVGLRVVDALASSEPLRGPGPLLVLQTYSSEVLAMVADRVPATTTVTVLHHLGLDDEVIEELAASALVSFDRVDHLTSLWVDGLRTAGEATDDLVDFMRRLRHECPWDRDQTHESLTRHLLEEAYEALDALEAMVRAQTSGVGFDEASRHVEEELGDLLFQVIFHAQLGEEEDLFNFATIADGVRDKLIGRHPHVFGDVEVADADEVASRWEVLKQAEKGRESVTDGIAWQLPALTLYAKLLAKSALVSPPHGSTARSRLAGALDALARSEVDDGDAATWGDALSALVEVAHDAGVDLEGVLRARAASLRDEIRAREAGR